MDGRTIERDMETHIAAMAQQHSTTAQRQAPSNSSHDPPRPCSLRCDCTRDQRNDAAVFDSQ